MRITGGTLVRRPLEAPKGDRTRPTTDRVREALFSILAARVDLEGARVVDLFAGSGALGLEALSRRAAVCTFVERHAPTLAVARRNARSLGLEDASTFAKADVLTFVGRDLEAADLVLADPPYDLEAVPSLPGLVRPHVASGGLFVLEHDAHHRFEDEPGWVLSRAYGRTVVSLFTGTEPV